MISRYFPRALALALAGLGQVAFAAGGDAALPSVIVRVGVSDVHPNSSATDAVGPFLPGPPSGVSLDVGNQTTAFFSIAKPLTEHTELEISLGYPPTHDVTAKLNPSIVPGPVVSSYQGAVIARIRQVAPTLFFNYKFGETTSAWRPFVGIGVNYTNFDKRSSTSAGNGLNGGPTDISLSDSWGLAAQAGLSYRIDQRWSLNASVATARVKTHLTATTAGAARTLDITFHPVVTTVSVGYAF